MGLTVDGDDNNDNYDDKDINIIFINKNDIFMLLFYYSTEIRDTENYDTQQTTSLLLKN